MRAILLTGLLFCAVASAWSCSCSGATFCGILNQVDEGVVFKGETLEVIQHGEGYSSVIVKVLSSLKGQGVLTDTVELFGGSNGASCETRPGFQAGEVGYFALIHNNALSFDIEGFEKRSPSYWVSSLHLCGYIPLRIEGDWIYGNITREVFRYPISIFEEALTNCSFSNEALKEEVCASFSVAPNPIQTSMQLENIDDLDIIDQLNIYSLSGQLLYKANQEQIQDNFFNLPLIEEGVVLIEVQCGSRRQVQKVLVTNQ